MENLIIYGTPKTPSIKFKYNEGYLEFSGLSIPENSLEFYQPIVKWIRDYLETPQSNSKMVFKLSYLNTSSLQAIYDIFVALEGSDFEVKWYYLSDDTDMKEIGEDFKSSVNVNISLIEVIAA